MYSTYVFTYIYIYIYIYIFLHVTLHGFGEASSELIPNLMEGLTSKLGG